MTTTVHSVSLSFRLSLSVNGRMAIWLYISHSNYHSAIQTQKYNIFYFEMSGLIAIQLFSMKKGVKISEQPNGNSAVHKPFSRSHSNTNGI